MTKSRVETGLIGGIEKREIAIADYDASWAGKFRVQAAKIAGAVGRVALRIGALNLRSMYGVRQSPLGRRD